MADILAVCLSFPTDGLEKLAPKDYDSKIAAFQKELGRISAAQWIKAIDRQNILDTLNPTTNTIPYLHALVVLTANIDKDRARNEELLDRAITFIASFNQIQIRYVGEQWTQLMKWTLDLLERTDSMDFTPISTAMLRLDPTAGTYTSWHLRLVQACLNAGVPTQALPILDQNIYAFPQTQVKNVPDELLTDNIELSNAFITPKSGFTLAVRTEHVLEYYLLGAHVYIGLRSYTRARIFLEFVILTPTQQHACSALQVEAYKKWVMIGLLAEGKTFPLPRTHDAAVIRSIKSIAKPYDALADSFERRDWRKYQAEMDYGTQIWHEDGNLRMVGEAGVALLRYRVSDLQKTYAALPVTRVASHIGFTPDDTAQMLTNMIRSRTLNASLMPSESNAPGDAVLRFHILATSGTNVEGTELEAQTKRIEDLVTFVRDADRRVQLTKEYIEYAKRTKRADGLDADLADHMDLTWDAPAAGMTVEDGDEEDIMAP